MLKNLWLYRQKTKILSQPILQISDPFILFQSSFGCFVLRNNKILVSIFWVLLARGSYLCARKIWKAWSMFFFFLESFYLRSWFFVGAESRHNSAYLLNFCVVWVMLKPKYLLQSSKRLINSVIQFHNYGYFHYFPGFSANS